MKYALSKMFNDTLLMYIFTEAFEIFIYIFEILYDVLNKVLPPSPNFMCSFLCTTHQVQLVLFIYTWVKGCSLKHGQFTMRPHVCRKLILSSLASIIPKVGFEALKPHSFFILDC